MKKGLLCSLATGVVIIALLLILQYWWRLTPADSTIHFDVITYDMIDLENKLHTDADCLAYDERYVQRYCSTFAESGWCLEYETEQVEFRDDWEVIPMPYASYACIQRYADWTNNYSGLEWEAWSDTKDFLNAMWEGRSKDAVALLSQWEASIYGDGYLETDDAIPSWSGFFSRIVKEIPQEHFNSDFPVNDYPVYYRTYQIVNDGKPYSRYYIYISEAFALYNDDKYRETLFYVTSHSQLKNIWKMDSEQRERFEKGLLDVIWGTSSDRFLSNHFKEFKKSIEQVSNYQWSTLNVVQVKDFN